MTRFAKSTCIAILLAIVALSTVQVQAAATDLKPFQGRWAMYVPGGAAWLEVKTDKNPDWANYPAANILWYGGSVVPTGCMPYVDEKNTLIVERVSTVPRRKDADGKVILSQQLVTRIECKLSGADEMACRYVSPQGNGRGVDVSHATAAEKLVGSCPAKGNAATSNTERTGNANRCRQTEMGRFFIASVSVASHAHRGAASVTEFRP